MTERFSEEQIRRYSRHILLPGVGGAGQERLLDGSVLCVGAGGLGSPVIQYLAAAGVGHLGIIDDDQVDLSNLQRQVIHAGNTGESKAESAREFVERLNPDVAVETHNTRLTPDNARSIIDDYDVVVDGSDNFPTRYLLNDACILEDTPLVHGSVFQFEGQATTIIPERGPCYRCVFPRPPPEGVVPSCQEAGVFGVLPGIIGLVQATEV